VKVEGAEEDVDEEVEAGEEGEGWGRRRIVTIQRRENNSRIDIIDSGWHEDFSLEEGREEHVVFDVFLSVFRRLFLRFFLLWFWTRSLKSDGAT
jgi:hypothetical protein